MISRFTSSKISSLFRLGIIFLISAFMVTSSGVWEVAQAQTIINLPEPGTMVPTSLSFEPLQLKGILVNVKNPLRFDFLVDKGDSGLSGQPLKDEIIRSAKYFLTCLAVPENDLWVNLSPYERDRIVPGNFGNTLMGKDLLEQDYLLKQIMASLSYPENDLGKRFWQRVYRKSYELYGTTEIPINTFNKVWIIPKSAQVYVQGNAAFVVNSQLDVMLEADYKAFVHHSQGLSQKAGAYSQVFRDVILPELRQEVNEGKNFATVRQVYKAMILATWYKRHLKDSLLGRMYVGKNQVMGVDIADKNAKEKIFQQYLKAYKKCVYNYIKEDYDPMTGQTVPRKYASGGMYFAGFGGPDSVYEEVPSSRGMIVSTESDLAMATINLSAIDSNGAGVGFLDPREITKTHPFHFEVDNKPSDNAMRAGLGNFLNRWTVGLMVAVGLGITFPQALKAATFSPGEQPGTIIMHVKDRDQLGYTMQKIREIYKELDPEGYKTSAYAGSLYPALDKVTDVKNKNGLKPGDQVQFTQPVPQNVLDALSGSVAGAVQSTAIVPTEKTLAPSVVLVSPAPASPVVQQQNRIEPVLPIASTVTLGTEPVSIVSPQDQTVPLQPGTPMIVPTEKNSAPSVVLVSPAPASPIIQKQPAIAVMVNPAKSERIPSKQTITPRPDQTITLQPATRMTVPTEKIPAPSVVLVSPAPASSVVQKQSRIKLVAPIRSTVKTVAKVESTEKTVPLQSGMPNIDDGADPHNNFLRHLHEKDMPLASTSPTVVKDQTVPLTALSSPIVVKDQTVQPTTLSSSPTVVKDQTVQQLQPAALNTNDGGNPHDNFKRHLQEKDNPTTDLSTGETPQSTGAGSPPPPNNNEAWSEAPSGLVFAVLFGIAGLGLVVKHFMLKRKFKPSSKNQPLQSGQKSGFNVVTDSGPALPDEEEREWIQRLQSQQQQPYQQSQQQIQQQFQPEPEQQQQQATAEAFFPPTINAKANDLSVKNVFKISTMDVSSLMMGIGFGFSAFTAGGSLIAVATASLGSFLATRLFYAGLLWLHEFGHILTALAQSPKDYKKILTSPNIFGNYNIDNWVRTAIAFISKPGKNAGVDLPLRKKARRFNQKAGFVFSSIVSGLAIWFAISIGLPVPLIVSLGIASLSLLYNSWFTDIKNPSPVGRIECGDSGFIWDPRMVQPTTHDPREAFFPQIFQEAQEDMRIIAGLRGDQGTGEFTWGVTPDGDVIPILFKVMKTKNGKPVVQVALLGFNEELKKASNRNIRPLDGAVREVMIHDRFLTQGTPSQEGLHPHLGVVVKRMLSFYDNEGVYHKVVRTIVSVLIENGDNNYHQKLGEFMPTSKIREFYPIKFHMEKTVYIEPDADHPKGYYDYLAKGDARPLALEEQWADNMGDFTGASLYSVDEIFFKSPEESIEHNLSEDEGDVLGNLFWNVWENGRQGDQTNEQILTRPKLKKKNKTLKDSWVTKEMAEEHPLLSFQYKALNKFRENLKAKLFAEAVMARGDESASPVGRILNRLQQLHPEESEEMFEDKIKRYVDMTVERFFTADILEAAEEIDERTKNTGQYAVRVLNSKYPGRGVFWTRGQSISLGENMKAGYIVYNSEHTALMTLGKTAPVNEILFLNSGGKGQLTDIYFDYETQRLVIKAYSPEKARFLKENELAEWRMQLSPDNEYFTTPVVRDQDNLANQDIADIPKATKESQENWDKPGSFIRQTAGAFFDKLASRYVELYIKNNSRYYKTFQGQLLYKIDELAQQCQGGQCSDAEANARRASLLRTVEQDPRILSYLKSRLDQLVAVEADQISQQIVEGIINEDDLFPLLKFIDEQILRLMDKEIQQLTVNLTNNNLEFLNNFEKQQEQIESGQDKMAQSWEADEDDTTEKLKPRMEGNGMPRHESIGSGEADIYAAGFGTSLWLGAENFREMMLSVFPKMIIETDSTNKALDLKPNDRRKFGRRSLGFVTTMSGATSSAKNDIPVFETISPGNNFVMTGDVVTLIGLDLGQRYYKGAPFKKRIFPTGNFYPSEVSPTSEVELLVNQIDLVIYLVKRMKKIFPHQRPWGMDLSDQNIIKLEQWRNDILNKTKHLTGFNEAGDPVAGYKENGEIIKNATIYGKMLSETFKIKLIFGSIIFGFFAIAAPFSIPILGSVLNTALALSLSWWLTTVFYRHYSKRVQRWARLGPPKVTIGDIPVLHQIVEVNASKRGAGAIASMDADYHGGDAEDDFAPRFLHRLRRGSVEIFGLPEEPHALANVLMTVSQSRVRNDMSRGFWLWDKIFGKRFKAGPEIFTIGHGETDPNLSQHHMNIGALETVTIDQHGNRILRPDVSEQLSNLYAHSFEVLNRLIAYNVFFNKAYDDATKLGGRRIWEQGKTLSRLSVYSTPSPQEAPKKALPEYHDADHSYSNVGVSVESGNGSLGGTDTDHAQIVSRRPGGIDMNSRLMQLKITGDTQNRLGNDDHAVLAPIIKGVVPQISSIVTVTPDMLRAMLGEGYLN